MFHLITTRAIVYHSSPAETANQVSIHHWYIDDKSHVAVFLTAYLIGKIDVYLYKAMRQGYNSNLKVLSELHDPDMKLFRSMLHTTHCIHQLLSHCYLCQ